MPPVLNAHLGRDIGMGSVAQDERLADIDMR